MKLVKFTKEIILGDFKAVIRKMSAGSMMDIQKKVIKVKDTAAMATEINKDNVLQYTETDTAMFRLEQVLASLVSWNLEADDSTPENIKYLPITAEIIKSDIFPNDLFVFIEKEVSNFNNPKKSDIKN